MDALLRQLLEGIDPADPDAAWRLFWRLMGLVDWWGLFWLTVACAAVGGLIGRYKGALWKGVLLGAALGPIGWAVALMAVQPPRACAACGQANPADARRCGRCGASLSAPVSGNPAPPGAGT